MCVWVSVCGVCTGTFVANCMVVMCIVCCYMCKCNVWRECCVFDSSQLFSAFAFDQCHASNWCNMQIDRFNSYQNCVCAIAALNMHCTIFNGTGQSQPICKRVLLHSIPYWSIFVQIVIQRQLIFDSTKIHEFFFWLIHRLFQGN